MSIVKDDVLGIIFPNSYDQLVPELTSVRLMASIPFASRYRLIDFVLSGMSNAGIDDVYVMVNKNYNSLTDHLGSGREWDLVRKNGGLHIFPPYSTENTKPYSGRIDALAGILDFLRRQPQKYVLISDANIACNYDFADMLKFHKETGADVTVAYNETEFPKSIMDNLSNNKGLYYTFETEGTRISNIYVNKHDAGKHNFSMNVYIVDRELLIDLVNTAFVRGKTYFERDVLLPQLGELNVQGYKVEQYAARISDLKAYFAESMKLLDPANLDALFAGAPVYTKIRDDNPTRYIAGSKVSNIMAADGCVIEGEVENSVLFRGVKIGKGAKVKNCILMQDTVVEAGADLEYIITDKDVVISEGKELKGNDNYPIYISKAQKV